MPTLFHVEHFARRTYNAPPVPVITLFMTPNKWAQLAIVSLALSPAAALALPGEAAAVLAHCGTPASDFQTVSPVTGQTERNLTYGNLILHFQQSAGDWSYMSAWDGHTPASQAKITKALPCFGDAMAEVKKTSVASGADPTLLADHTETTPGIHFGPAFLWLLAAIALALLISVAIPSSRQKLRKKVPFVPGTSRRPRISRFAGRRKPSALNDLK